MWLHTFPCADVDCGTLGNPANGMVSVSTTTYNSVATYSCNTGHTLTGDDMRTCLETGLWSNTEPTCTGEFSVCVRECVRVCGELKCFTQYFVKEV